MSYKVINYNDYIYYIINIVLLDDYIFLAYLVYPKYSYSYKIINYKIIFYSSLTLKSGVHDYKSARLGFTTSPTSAPTSPYR